MAFKVGDRVVYPHHGAAVIERKEKREMFGEKVEYLVLRVTHGDLTLMVPVEKAEEVGIRPPVSKDEVEDILDVLAKKDARHAVQLVASVQEPSREAQVGRRVPSRRGGAEPVSFATATAACRAARRRCS